jgi:hypothetical protein
LSSRADGRAVANFIAMAFSITNRKAAPGTPTRREGVASPRDECATGVSLWQIARFGIGMYLGKAGVSSGFGAAGSIVVLLVWVFYSSQIFLLGAEFTWLYAHSRGTKAQG